MREEARAEGRRDGNSSNNDAERRDDEMRPMTTIVRVRTHLAKDFSTAFCIADSRGGAEDKNRRPT